METTQDGLVGEEGTFSICTFWACEAAARLGMFKKEYLEKGRLMFEQMLGYANHLGLYSEEIGRRGEHLGNFPQARNNRTQSHMHTHAHTHIHTYIRACKVSTAPCLTHPPRTHLRLLRYLRCVV